jgi:uncharacterized protein YjbJ (UPF0337 family)
MNRDQAKGKAKELQGDIQKKVGKLTGDTETRARGTAKEVEGKMQKGVGNVKDALDTDDDLDLGRDDALRRDRDL